MAEKTIPILTLVQIEGCVPQPVWIAFEYLKQFPCLPVVLKRGEGREKYGRPSNSEIKRWLENGSVAINEKTPKPHDEIEFPITELVFFPTGKTVTIFQDSDVWERRNKPRWQKKLAY